LQRATLAEKEVTTLKEQLSGNNGGNCENKDTSNMDRQSLESEIVAKDDKVGHVDVTLPSSNHHHHISPSKSYLS